MGDTPVLDVRGIGKTFAGSPVLRGIDLAVTRGRSIALLGRSGAGKSTLLRIVAGLEAPDEGSVSIDGVDVTSAAPHRRGVGFMFQDHALFPHRDVFGNVAFGLRMHRRPRAEIAERVAGALDLVGLPDAGPREVGSLSGGERQRVALARALAPEPKLLLLDEPFGALDRSLRDRLVVELREIFTRLGLTVVSVTHDASEAATLADDIAVIDEGTIIQRGTGADVLAEPSSASVARLVGHPNVTTAARVGGGLATPWGDVGGCPGPDLTVDVLVRPDAVIPDANGPVTATVTGIAYRAGAAVIRLQVASDTVPIEAAGWPPLPVGTPVRYRLDPAGVIVLGEPSDQRSMGSDPTESG